MPECNFALNNTMHIDTQIFFNQPKSARQSFSGAEPTPEAPPHRRRPFRGAPRRRSSQRAARNSPGLAASAPLSGARPRAPFRAREPPFGASSQDSGPPSGFASLLSDSRAAPKSAPPFSFQARRLLDTRHGQEGGGRGGLNVRGVLNNFPETQNEHTVIQVSDRLLICRFSGNRK